MTKLTGITWDHPRGYDPLVYTSEVFSRLNPDITITWKKRSLQEFGDYPVARLSEEYDLLLIDHPFTGQAFSQKLYANLSECVSAKHLESVAREEIGQSVRCYAYGGQQLALPVDVSAVVSVARNDLLEQCGIARPVDMEDLLLLNQRLPANMEMLIPLCPTDIWCLYLSLGAACAGYDFIRLDAGPDRLTSHDVIEKIRRLAGICKRNPFSLNPIHVLDAMASGDEIAYSPYLFAYINYAVKGRYPHPLTFYASPLWKGARTATVLGGVGIAISSKCSNIEAAARYVEYVTSTEVQSGDYFRSGGQPGLLSAWQSPENNEASGNFFKNILPAMQNAYLRPRWPGWNEFQEAGSIHLGAGIESGRSAEAITTGLHELFHHYVGKEPAVCTDI